MYSSFDLMSFLVFAGISVSFLGLCVLLKKVESSTRMHTS